jgi:uncharacterized membrane protein YukC
MKSRKDVQQYSRKYPKSQYNVFVFVAVVMLIIVVLAYKLRQLKSI